MAMTTRTTRPPLPRRGETLRFPRSRTSFRGSLVPLSKWSSSPGIESIQQSPRGRTSLVSRYSHSRSLGKSEGTCLRTGASGDTFAFTEGPQEEKFVELEADLEAYGPPAILLLGISPEDKSRVRSALDKYGADFVTVASVTQRMYDSLSLWEAMQEASSKSQGEDLSSDAPAPQVLLPVSLGAEGAGGVPANVGLCLMSGLTGEECLEMVDIVEEELSHLGRAGLAFAAMLPNFSQRALKDVVSDILGDHVSCTAGVM